MLPTFAPLFDENTIFTEKRALSAQLEKSMGIWTFSCPADAISPISIGSRLLTLGVQAQLPLVCISVKLLTCVLNAGSEPELVRVIFQLRIPWPPIFSVIAPVRFAEFMVGA